MRGKALGGLFWLSVLILSLPILLLLYLFYENARFCSGSRADWLWPIPDCFDVQDSVLVLIPVAGGALAGLGLLFGVRALVRKRIAAR